MKIGIFSDAHGVIGSFETAMDILTKAGASCFIFLGDAIGYVPHLGVLRSLMQSKIIALKGNHEDMLLAGNIPPEKDEVYMLSAVRKNMTNRELEFIQALPEQYEQTWGDIRCLFIHGSPTAPIYGYVYPDTELSDFSEITEEMDFVFMGNTHRPFIKKCGHVVYVNVGSCGIPRDGSKSGTACVLDSETGEICFLEIPLAKAAIITLREPYLHPSVIRYLEHFAH